MWKELASLCFFIGVCSAKITEKQYAYMPDLFHLDDYDKCMMYGDEALYCYSTYVLQPLDRNNPPEVWKIVEEVSSKPTNYRHDHIRHGICITTTCQNVTRTAGKPIDEDYELHRKINDCYDTKYFKLGLKGVITKIHCETTEPVYPIDWIDYTVAVVAVAYLAFIVFASLYEGTARYKTPEEYEKITGTKAGRILSAFSIPKNWIRLKTVKDTEEIRSLRCIQGVRFYNMVCVIMAHSVMTILAGPVSNPIYTESITKKFLNMFLANGGYAVQTFFLISGWLLTYHFFVEFEGKKEIKLKYLVMAFINRYLRLTPTLAVMITLHSTWLVHISRGPTWDNIIGQEYRNCRKNGWTNLLYLNNYIDPTHMCLQQTWYSAADTQLFLVCLIIMAIILKFKKYALHIIGISLTIGILIPGSISFYYNFDIVNRCYPEILYTLYLNLPQWHIMFSSGYTNLGGYTTGMLFGYIYYKCKNIKLFQQKVHVFLWWIFSFGLGLFVVIIGVKMYDENFQYNRFEAAAYWSLGRNLFVLAIGITILGMIHNIGWIARSICQSSSVQVLGRLTYSAYMVHVAVARIRISYIRAPIYAATQVFITATLSDIVISYIMATLLYLMVEIPMIAIQKMLIPHLGNKKTCMPQTWYLGVDTQYFILQLLLVWIMFKYRKLIPYLLGGLLVLQSVVLYIISYKKNLDAAVRPHPEYMYGLNIIRLEEWFSIIGSVYANAAGFIEGMGFGYAYYRFKNNNLFAKKIYVVLWWILVYGCPLSIIILPGLYIYNENYVHNIVFNATYIAVGRAIFAFGIGLGLFGVTQGIGWMTKWSLEWAPTYVLGRLTFSVYVSHLFLAYYRMGSIRREVYITDMNLVCELMLQLPMSILLGLFVTLLVELPVSELLKILMTKKTLGKQVNDSKLNNNLSLQKKNL